MPRRPESKHPQLVLMKKHQKNFPTLVIRNPFTNVQYAYRLCHEIFMMLALFLGVDYPIDCVG